MRLRLGPPSKVAGPGFPRIRLILATFTQGPVVMIDRPPPPAAPKSDHALMIGRATEVAGRQRVCRCGAGTPEALDHDHETLGINMQTLLHDLGITTGAATA